MSRWITVAKVEEVPPGSAKCVDGEGRPIAVFNLDGELRAVDDRCPHRGGPLSEGTRSDAIVTCPWHRARFDLKTGLALEGPASRKLNCFAVKVDAGLIKIEVPE